MSATRNGGTVAGVHRTSWGWVGGVMTPRGLTCLMLPRGSRVEVDAELADRYGPIPTDSSRLARVFTALERYFAGERDLFDFPLDLSGTAFQLEVWAALRRIPYGETLSYGDVARAIGRPRSCRAVGNAVGSNPVGIVVPCHRVIAAGGAIGGFGGNLALKRRLLAVEGVTIP